MSEIPGYALAPTPTCANLRCQRPIGAEFVFQRSTKHLRWFCDPQCVADGLAIHQEIIGAMWPDHAPPSDAAAWDAEYRRVAVEHGWVRDA